MMNFEKILGDWMDYCSESNRLERYEGMEKWYGGSSSGSCRRKLYYKTNSYEKTNETTQSSMRKMRLGTIFHEDMEEALAMFNQYSSDNKWDKGKFHIEKELRVPELNLRGFADAIYESPVGEIHLYDFKTAGSYPWKLKFGRSGNQNDEKYALQLGSYGEAVKREFGRLDLMALVYYNKDNSDMRTVEVPLHYTDKAVEWWKETRDSHKEGLPPLRPGENPSASWECNYCDWKDLCLK